jgi:hypothetical protein
MNVSTAPRTSRQRQGMDISVVLLSLCTFLPFLVSFLILPISK